jgi:subtilase family serine protease
VGIATAAQCAASYPSSCLTPSQLAGAYFPGQTPDAPAGSPQTIALVDAFGDPQAEADLAAYSSEFGLPACTSANGCFKQVGQNGAEGASGLPFPRSEGELEARAKGTASERAQAEEAEGWALETATDVEMAHAICRNCHILLVEARSSDFADLEAAEDLAAARAGEISNSWGGPEALGDSPAFDHPGVAITASAGDDGYRNWDLYETRQEAGSSYFPGADYPASSPHVVAVGGTRLQLTAASAWRSESPWNGEGAGGGGCSESLVAPVWQLAVPDWSGVGCGALRASADVAAVADPSTGVSVYDTFPYPLAPGTATVLRWLPIGGTSVASPIVAAMFALAGGADGVAYPAQTLYSHLGSSLLHDVSNGGNGACDGVHAGCSGSLSPLSPHYPLDCGAGAWICNAHSGYDGPTGVGTPNGIAAFEPGAAGAGNPQSGSTGQEGTGGEPSSQEATGGESPGSSETSGEQAPPVEAPVGGNTQVSSDGEEISSDGGEEDSSESPSQGRVSPRRPTCTRQSRSRRHGGHSRSRSCTKRAAATPSCRRARGRTRSSAGARAGRARAPRRARSATTSSVRRAQARCRRG